MIRALRIPSRWRDDSGALLVIAMIIVTVVALVTGLVLTRGDGSLRATIALRDVAGSTYAADGAAQAAVNALRTGYSPTALPPYDSSTKWAFYNDDDGTGCFGKRADGAALNELALNEFYPGSGRDKVVSALVSCAPEEGTGRMGSPVYIDENNKPGNAILTLGTSPSEVGLYAKPLSGPIPFKVQGGIISNSTIQADGGNIVSTESISAVGTCSPVANMVAPDVDCPGGDAGIDPGYDTEVEETGAPFPEHQTPPTGCTATVTFEPGYYDNVKKLNDLTNSSACRDSVYWFKPGSYYFDFKNNTNDPLHDADLVAPNGGSNPDQWVIKYGTLIGGTRTGDNAVPGTCVNPIETEEADGVQFVFGGDSQIRFEGTANGELCGTYSRLRPPVAFYALGDGQAMPTQLAGAQGLTANAVGNSGAFVVGPMPNALSEDGGPLARWQNASGNNTTSLTLNGFAPPVNIPKGAILTGATLRVRHSEFATATTSDASKVTITVPSTTPSTVLSPIALPIRRSSLTTDSIPLHTTSATSSQWKALKQAIYSKGFNGAQLKYDAIVRGAGTAEVDSVRLELTYVAPQFRAQTTAGFGAPNCMRVGGGCAVLSSPESYSGALYIQGTTYAPVSRIDLALSTATEQVMKFGVVARSLAIKETGSYGYTGNVIEIPADGPGYGWNSTIVHLTVHLCRGSATCTTSGPVALTVRVQLWDPTGTPRPPGRRVKILSWSHNR